ncbi:MAG: phenylalanine--tRNA ligase subunit alpha [Planctomycetota bacterium]|jgi:phenylalanyl-tRNA synthetase alpha chain
MSEALLTQADQAVTEIEAAADLAALEALRVKCLGKKGLLRDLRGQLKSLPKEDRREFGQRLNELKDRLEAAIKERKAALEAAKEAEAASGFFDVTLPGRSIDRGSLHPLTQITRELLEVFQKLGFTLARGPEVEEPFYNFEALNIPADHPARDAAENFYLEGPEEGPEARLLRSQTSTVQIRTMAAGKPPFRVVAPGKVFRPDTVDATHHFQFHQIEGLAVAEGISFRDLKTVLLLFAKELFGPDQAVRLRPSFFPFTEPSAEVDFRCWICGGPGCSTCKQTGWIELGGCGMVDPHVLRAVNIDPERYTGYAFGLGIERLAMIRFGIDDLRSFTENDLRFLTQLGA